MQPQPIEVVVIRDLTPRRLPPQLLPPPADALGEFSSQQQRELDGVLEMLKCDVRRKILLTLARAGAAASPPTSNLQPLPSAGRVNVSEIARRTGICAKKISNHLNHLRIAGLVLDHRAGQCREYELAPDRVHYDCDPATSHLRLAIRSRGGGVGVTIEVGWQG